MSFKKIRKNFSIVFLTNFAVGSVVSVSSIFAVNERDRHTGKDVDITEIGNSGVSKDEHVNNEEEADKDLQNEDRRFEGVKRFVLSLLKNENGAEFARKDRGAQWTLSYFYGRLEEKVKQCKGTSELKELKLLKEKIGKSLECLYRYIDDVEKSKMDSDTLLMTAAASNNYKEVQTSTLKSQDGQENTLGQGTKK